jgi:hypothetical protein
MKRLLSLAALATAFCVLVSAQGTAGDMKMELKIDGSNPRVLQNKFGTYGYRKQQVLWQEIDGIRFVLPEAEGTAQSGIYSYFALAGDCEVVLTYELLKVPPPTKGYGCGLGIAFDIGEGGRGGRGDLQRVLRKGKNDNNGVKLHSHVSEKGKPKLEQPDVFAQNDSKKGLICLRRVGKELIGLMADGESDPLQEIGRLPFTDETIRAVRLFADPGGSPTVVDVRLRRIEMRAEQITGGVAEKDVVSYWWVPILVVVLILTVCAGVGWLLWREYRKQYANDEDEKPVTRKPSLKKT